MEFHGILWNSTAFYGIPRRSMEFHGVPWNSTAFYGIPRHSMEFHGIIWNATEFYGIPRHFMEFHPISSPPSVFFTFPLIAWNRMESQCQYSTEFHLTISIEFHMIPRQIYRRAGSVDKMCSIGSMYLFQGLLLSSLLYSSLCLLYIQNMLLLFLLKIIKTTHSIEIFI